MEGTGWDTGSIALVLALDQARYVTGMALVVDGSATISSSPTGGMRTPLDDRWGV